MTEEDAIEMIAAADADKAVGLKNYLGSFIPNKRTGRDVPILRVYRDKKISLISTNKIKEACNFYPQAQ